MVLRRFPMVPPSPRTSLDHPVNSSEAFRSASFLGSNLTDAKREYQGILWRQTWSLLASSRSCFWASCRSSSGVTLGGPPTLA